MKPKTIGIIGGAGPLAGALLLEKILIQSTALYGCYKDADFPKIVLISFPFSEMLSGDLDTEQVRKELKQSLAQLRMLGASVLAIACNTLHAFLEDERDSGDLVHVPRALAESIVPSLEPLVLCTSTSVRYGLHKQFFPCTYPDCETQTRVDRIIDLVLKGGDRKNIIQQLDEIISAQIAKTIVLGCTELSLFAQQIKAGHSIILDPLEITTKKILEKSFGRKVV